MKDEEKKDGAPPPAMDDVLKRMLGTKPQPKAKPAGDQSFPPEPKR